MVEKIKYWWSEDRQWFCILSNDGAGGCATVSLTTSEAADLAAEASGPPLLQPRVVDNDAGEIAVSLNGKELRGWSYKDDAERRTKMLAAREYVEGYCDGRA
jgi:hypothetical protein